MKTVDVILLLELFCLKKKDDVYYKRYLGTLKDYILSKISLIQDFDFNYFYVYCQINSTALDSKLYKIVSDFLTYLNNVDKYIKKN